MTKGKFIAFEGLDGSGSSTNAALLVEWLNKNNKKAVLTKEPTDNLIGGLIRGQLKGDWKTGPEVLQMLFAADRGHHLEKDVLPAVEAGTHVVSDRYFFSSLAFGGTQVDMDWLKELNKHFRLPDLVFFVKVPAKVCVERIHKTRYTIELFEKLEALEKVMKNYEKLASDPDYEAVFVTIDGTQPLEAVQEEVRRITRERLGL
ncbi:MAG TPA: dTMP kinase [archaeon]|nr:dTMP kinase [archaeon]